MLPKPAVWESTALHPDSSVSPRSAWDTFSEPGPRVALAHKDSQPAAVTVGPGSSPGPRADLSRTAASPFWGRATGMATADPLAIARDAARRTDCFLQDVAQWA